MKVSTTKFVSYPIRTPYQIMPWIISCKAPNEITSESHLLRQALEFPNICRKSLPRDSSHQQPLVVSSSNCFLQSRPSSFLCAWQLSQFMPSFPGNPFHKQHPAFAFGYERKGLGNSGWMIALPWSQQLVKSPASLCIIYSLYSQHRVWYGLLL